MIYSLMMVVVVEVVLTEMVMVVVVGSRGDHVDVHGGEIDGLL